MSQDAELIIAGVMPIDRRAEEDVCKAKLQRKRDDKAKRRAIFRLME